MRHNQDLELVLEKEVFDLALKARKMLDEKYLRESFADRAYELLQVCEEYADKYNHANTYMIIKMRESYDSCRNSHRQAECTIDDAKVVKFQRIGV
jgi:hypothetical protein